MGRARPLSDPGATARLYRAVAQAHLSCIVKVDPSEKLLYGLWSAI